MLVKAFGDRSTNALERIFVKFLPFKYSILQIYMVYFKGQQMLFFHLVRKLYKKNIHMISI